MAKGLNVLFRANVQQGYFSGYKVGNLTISHFQFADDTLIVGEKRSLNVWSIKVILQLFESISGLKVNFYKSKLFGINMGERWLQQAANFLNCEVGNLPFIYLALPVGVNSSRKVTWQLVLDKIRNRL